MTEKKEKRKRKRDEKERNTSPIVPWRAENSPASVIAFTAFCNNSNGG